MGTLAPQAPAIFDMIRPSMWLATATPMRSGLLQSSEDQIILGDALTFTTKLLLLQRELIRQIIRASQADLRVATLCYAAGLRR